MWLSVRAGELAVRQRDGAYVHLDGRVRTIVAAGRGFCVTTPAIRHCSAKHIELFISDDAAAFVSLFAPTAIGDARRVALKVRERQFRAAFDPARTVAIARAIVAAKVRAEGHRRETGQVLLQRAKTVEAVRHVEAQAAQEFWRQWAGFEIPFAGPAVTAGRLGELAAQFTARGAVHPMQAMLNFSTAIVTARLTRAIVAIDMDGNDYWAPRKIRPSNRRANQIQNS